MWYKVNTMVFMNWNNSKFPKKISFYLDFMFIKYTLWRTGKLLQSENIHFDATFITESRMPKNLSITQRATLNNYSFKHTRTESSTERLSVSYDYNCRQTSTCS